jgi:energy-coupling factor transporter ATP-binding protein EcfA2
VTKRIKPPFLGLVPFGASDAPYFFGREEDLEIVLANLRTARITVLYGPSGSGKSSLLGAGAKSQIEQTEDRLVCVVTRWHAGDPGAVAIRTLADEVESASGIHMLVDDDAPLDAFVARCAFVLGNPIALVFDQFEEYFYYHATTDQDLLDRFEGSVASLVNDESIPATLMVSLRDDALWKLERFEGRIPNLLGNTLRLHHLSGPAIRKAIEGPVLTYNRLLVTTESQAQPMEIAPGFVDALVRELLDSSDTSGATGLNDQADPMFRLRRRSNIPGSGAARSISVRADSRDDAPHRDPLLAATAPALQLVMQKIWAHERYTQSNRLQVKTLVSLGGKHRIVDSYVNERMQNAGLVYHQRDTTAVMLQFMISASRTKQVVTARDFPRFTNGNISEASAQTVLDRMADEPVELIRRIPPLRQSEPSRYEIQHDVLVPGLESWRERTRNRPARLLQPAAIIVATLLLALVAARSPICQPLLRTGLRLTAALVLNLIAAYSAFSVFSRFSEAGTRFYGFVLGGLGWRIGMAIPLSITFTMFWVGATLWPADEKFAITQIAHVLPLDILSYSLVTAGLSFVGMLLVFAMLPVGGFVTQRVLGSFGLGFYGAYLLILLTVVGLHFGCLLKDGACFGRFEEDETLQSPYSIVRWIATEPCPALSTSP